MKKQTCSVILLHTKKSICMLKILLKSNGVNMQFVVKTLMKFRIGLNNTDEDDLDRYAELHQMHKM